MCANSTGAFSFLRKKKVLKLQKILNILFKLIHSVFDSDSVFDSWTITLPENRDLAQTMDMMLTKI